MLAGVLFYALASIILVSSVAVLVSKNPVFSALNLAVTMIGLSFMFFLLQAYFVASVQLIVYAGAVMVLFVIVIMLFDLKKEIHAYSKGIFSGFLKIVSAGALLGILFAILSADVELSSLVPAAASTVEHQMTSTKQLSYLLFSDYLFAFEALGVLLLLIAVGAVALSRIKGGTHADS